MQKIDVFSLFVAMTLNLSIMAVALPYFMGRVNRAARYAQTGVVLQTAGWICLFSSSTFERGGWADHLLSTLAMGCVSSGMVFNAMAFQIWCGRKVSVRAPIAIAVLMTVGYSIGFSDYPFRVGWANALLALQIATVVVELCRPPQVAVGRWRWLLAICLTIQMIVLACRAVLGAFYTAEFPNFFGPYLVNQVFALSSNSMMVMSVVAILLAHRDEAARELERLAMLDGLTGALNRRAWLLQSGIDLASSVRYRQPIGLLMLDLDYFKQINDTHGHAVGDHALQLFVTGLRAVSRAGDVFCRYGGEEFCVLLKCADFASVMAYDQRMRQWLAEHSPQELGFKLSYSAGIAMRVHEGDTIDTMLQRADVALYEAKSQGRGCTLASSMRLSA
ncbi:GGDEF domain-containing protein [Herminiimonas arsenitoxidans]|uniref:GGDEF domain-containing protein n=1 Tax=Herminiimonas arsenitoxidans TaxID=1809410 RepID=UPI0009FA4D27|nr:GGDEF domain-containing protein [Herminiimonas arsenitoxidans]